MGDIPVWVSFMTIILGPTGAAWVGVRTALNGTRERVRKIDEVTSHMGREMTDVRVRVAKIEGKLEGGMWL